MAAWSVTASNANNIISTSLNNSVMTVEKLRITSNGLPSGTRKVELDNNGVRLNLAGTWVLKRGMNDYVTEWLVVGADITNNTITSTHIDTGAITSTKIANNTITNIKIASGSITCDKLNIPGLNCTVSVAPNGVCPSGQFLQWIPWGVYQCAPWGGAGAIVCQPGDTLVRDILLWWICQAPNQSNTGWDSLWDYSLPASTNSIFNKNYTGKVWVGIDIPTHTLTVSGSMKVRGNGTPGISSGTATPDANSIFVVTNGKVGILTNSPQYELDVVGDVRAISVTQVSDARLKTNITLIDNALDSLLQINGYSYILTVNGKKQYWVLAQEVEQFFPHLVSTDSNGYKSVNYNWLAAPIIQALHELDAKVTRVEEQYRNNESRISALEKLLAK